MLKGIDGNFYGTTVGGGIAGFGTLFRITPTGTLTTLFNFADTNGKYPLAGLTLGNDGNLYGTTAQGGTTSSGQPAGGGQIYRLRMGPTVVTQVQTNVSTLGATLNGTVNPGGYATPVSFHYGTAPTLATFQTAGAGTLPVGISDMAVQATISGLLPETIYYYRVLASNVENTVPQYGTILSFTTLAPPGSYSSWATTRFTPSQLADPLISGPDAEPDFDGIVNLLESAFNMLPLSSGNQILTPGTGTVGLPLISTLGSGPSTRLRIEYIRRKTGYTYSPEVSDGLDNGGWTAPAGTPSITSIDADWERVVIEDTAGTGQPTRFGRVTVTSPAN